MIELIQEAIALYNLPLTALLGMVLFYWLLVLIGMLDFDLDLFDFGGGEDGVPDMTVEHPSSMGGAMLTAGRFLGFSQVPIAVWGSFFTLFLWAAALFLNYRFNGEAGARSLDTAAWLLLPATGASLALTKLVTLPLARLFAAMAGAETESQTVVGRDAVVVTSSLDATHGQVEVSQDGVPTLLNARLCTGADTGASAEMLHKGDRVRVLEASADGLFYFVEPAQPQTLP